MLFCAAAAAAAVGQEKVSSGRGPVFTRKGVELGLEVLEGEVDVQPLDVGAEERADGGEMLGGVGGDDAVGERGAGLRR